jgi:hypothetical protein
LDNTDKIPLVDQAKTELMGLPVEKARLLLGLKLVCPIWKKDNLKGVRLKDGVMVKEVIQALRGDLVGALPLIENTTDKEPLSCGWVYTHDMHAWGRGYDR